MTKPIKISFDCKRLDKSLFKSAGENKLFVNLVAWPMKNGPDEWGNTHYIKQDLPKGSERRDLPIIGNLKLYELPPRADTQPPNPGADKDIGDEVPF